jgi:hypothetical protein
VLIPDLTNPLERDPLDIARARLSAPGVTGQEVEQADQRAEQAVAALSRHRDQRR